MSENIDWEAVVDMLQQITETLERIQWSFSTVPEPDFFYAVKKENNMTALTIELLNPRARTILDGLEDIGLIAVNQTPSLPPLTKSHGINANDFWHQKSVEESAEEQGVGPIYDWEKLFGYGKDLWETEEEWNDYMEVIQTVRREGM